MNASIAGLNLVIATTGLLMCLLCLAHSYLDEQMERTSRKFLIVLFTVLTGYILFNIAGQVVDDFNGPAFSLASRALLFFESITGAAATPILLAFILRSCGERRWSRSVAFSIAVALLIVYLVMLITNEFTGMFYSIDIDNVYHRGPLYPAILVPPILIMVLGLIALWRRRSNLSRSQQAAFTAYFFVPMAFMVCQMLLYGIYATILGTALGSFAMLVNLRADQRERIFKAEMENAKLKSDIMLSQLQPHFLCNTLGAIGGLCKNDPEARDAINTFSRYLRENVDAISQDTPVPFDQELEHAKTYLMLEQLRFGDDVSVVYDIGCRDFQLPTLTLQPLVENAVRHGIRGTEEGVGTVTISSQELDNRWEVSVADDGAGFDPALPPAQDGRSHIGLRNVRTRLELVCNGKLRIDSESGCGSVVTIEIPKGGVDEDIRNRR